MKKTAYFSVFLFLVQFSFSQLLNGNMENYVTNDYDTIPEHWSVSSNYATATGRMSDAHSGSSAFVINTWYYYGPGAMVNGQLNWYDVLSNWIKGGTPISGKPLSLKGFYKYTVALTTDSALAEVILKKWNVVKNKPDTLCYGRVALPLANTYKPFEISIHDYSPGVQPDSIVVHFLSHDTKNIGMPGPSNCRFLYIDDISLSYGTTVTGIEKTAIETAVSFHATHDELTIFNPESKSFTVELWSLDGKHLAKKEITLPQDKMALYTFSKGVYLLKTKGDVVMEQKIFKE